jgi:hypothetical protein
MREKFMTPLKTFLLSASIISASVFAAPPSKNPGSFLGKKAIPGCGKEESGKPTPIVGVVGSTEAQLKKATGELFPNARDALSDSLVTTNSIADFFVMPEGQIQKLLTPSEYGVYKKWKDEKNGKMLYFKIVPDAKNKPSLVPVYTEADTGLADAIMNEHSIWQYVLARMKGLSQTNFYQSIFQDHSGEISP